MKDFSAPYRRKVAYFGIWNDEGRDVQMGNLDAWAVLCDAVRRTTTEDMAQSQNVQDALAWFESKLLRPQPVNDFRKGLKIQDPMQRYWALVDALRKLRQFMGH